MKRKMYMTFAFSLVLSIASLVAHAQPERWQQKVNYQMEVSLNTQNHQYTGTQKLVFTNNSPDTLHKVFYHLYYNAFQPNSAMDVRSRTISDPDARVRDRISKLDDSEIGFLQVSNLKMNGKAISQYEHVGTILEVTLDKPIMPKSSATFELDFKGQVPLQVRRSGRDSDEGIAYSMSQWYPKMANYDYQGWHANPYIGREFYGIWGDFDVKITIDKSFILGGTGYLQNPQQIGYGYEKPGSTVNRPSGQTLTWHFKAPMVHDFMWAADPDYTHDVVEMPNGITVHHLYQKNSKTAENWEKLKEYTPKAIDFLSKNFGQYPYKQFSVIQGGDGGMEYPMSTLITGERNLGSLVGVMVHELAHSWFHGVLASNESLYPWMDEGFTSYASSLAMRDLFNTQSNDPHRGSYGGYYGLVRSGLEEPMSTHADHYNTNRAYGSAAYSKGAVFLEQLGYIIGAENRDKGMLRYFETWKFKHPNVNDLIRVMEKTSGIELDWYKEYFVFTTKTIDYGIKEVRATDSETKLILERVGDMPMPLDVVVTYADGTQELYYIPLEIMRGSKPTESNIKRVDAKRWSWTHPYYELSIPKGAGQIKSVEIDPSGRMADVDRSNNSFELSSDLKLYMK
ncbi:M1 family metallopeptidase [Penaeicola halotolerans]|uniref:M1 family metallopeptidase n=1 Tax=Penaeicola halotolerans TaxID=2793196 RepID=UPI001CF91D70|nr:M1 family metallopeptidase [Penaeicola halotolerans]